VKCGADYFFNKFCEAARASRGREVDAGADHIELAIVVGVFAQDTFFAGLRALEAGRGIEVGALLLTMQLKLAAEARARNNLDFLSAGENLLQVGDTLDDHSLTLRSPLALLRALG